jgi:hypothetical protein
MTASVGFTTRLTSSHVFQPTSPTQTSLVPGRMVKRNGFRSPCAMIRRAFGSELPASGLVGTPAPVVGSTPSTAPSRETGSPLVRRSWLRSAPPSAVGGVSAAPTPPGGSPHGLTGLPSCP